MKTPAERGRIGAWAYEARQDADLSVEEVQERLARAGHIVTASTLRGVEGGSKRPSRRLLRAMASVYGQSVPGEPQPADPEPTLAAALSALVEELRAARSDRESQEERLRTLEAAVRFLIPPSGGASQARSAPDESAG